MTERLNVIERLVELGFTQYEARAYVGLLGQAPMTGYALSNGTKIPQPKVYETLRRLEDKHVVVRINDEPARYVAVSPDHLMSRLEGDFGRRLADARLSLHRLHLDDADEGLRVMNSLGSFAASATKATSLMEAASRHVYLSLHSDQLDDLTPAIMNADSRGVRVDLLLFGRGEITLRHGRLVRHASTSGIVYRHHQARHLALVADTDEALWALAPAGRDWQGIYAKDALLAAVVKGYVRHDLYVQQIFADLGEELEARYGPGMEALISTPPEAAEATRDSVADAAETAPVRPTRRSRSA
ncbi:TrmB family transcriptional regulator [Streptomyces luteolifulvus]|uniref:TrmB family transcriptional regulator n=1 Tax=Streptomyces luteolifulvus TaxID=2615112 RepID=A0A6H9UNF7_9ACTN|nr:TrmB family transcriptional regulator [Streptomyces luteolifulvus]KAB1139639.1 TrmB family transcriptional regulator [Streptomyces luteolifulvus]